MVKGDADSTLEQEDLGIHLIVQALVVECYVEGEGGRVVMWPQ